MTLGQPWKGETDKPRNQQKKSSLRKQKIVQEEEILGIGSESRAVRLEFSECRTPAQMRTGNPHQPGF